MRYVAATMMLLGGCTLGTILLFSGDASQAPSGLLDKTYAADKADRISNLRQVGGMVGKSVEERTKAWVELDKAAFTKNFDAVGEAVSTAIFNGKELDLASQWEKE
jgi:hypothetical protein